MERVLTCVRDQLSASQFAFTRGRSALEALLRLLGLTKYAIDSMSFYDLFKQMRSRAAPSPVKSPHTCIVLLGLLDLSDAFCRVPHVHVIDALLSFRVNPYLIDFVRL